MTDIDLSRFHAAQAPVWEQVLGELRAGRKRTHWSWFVFPQLAGLGHSQTARLYALDGVDEARAWLADPVLGPRLFAALDALHACGRDANTVLGTVDALKLQSCLTLMLAAAPGDPHLTRALAQWFDGHPDPLTQALLRG
jgi:uncharacterized protein (DUF1810 family)